jgi:hypothetical protein
MAPIAGVDVPTAPPIIGCSPCACDRREIKLTGIETLTANPSETARRRRTRASSDFFGFREMRPVAAASITRDASTGDDEAFCPKRSKNTAFLQ